MSENQQSHNYKQGYSSHTTSTHESRTADSSASFLLPHIKKTDRILDIGCGSGTITTGLAKLVPEGSVTGVDMSPEILARAKTLAAQSPIPAERQGSVIFEQGNVLEKLPYPDDTFDIVYNSQLMGHIPPPDLPRQAVSEMRRVLKPGGILASRAAISSHFYPASSNLDRLWYQNLSKVLRQGAPAHAEDTGSSLPAIYRSAGFDVEGGKVQVSAGTMVVADKETRMFFARRTAGQLSHGDPFYQSWLDAGISEDEIRETVDAVKKWAETEDAWFAGLQCEILGWK
ncbi:S-adenosyl-L-methionine-dependent methyltransferase [Xylariaceae sp. FL0255]|nr:S-adenosyl-L-methionine-dependent methyltransferase [Xylariaceae sp. FL0255]